MPSGRRRGGTEQEAVIQLEGLLADQRRMAEVAFAQFTRGAGPRRPGTLTPTVGHLPWIAPWVLCVNPFYSSQNFPKSLCRTYGGNGNGRLLREKRRRNIMHRVKDTARKRQWDPERGGGAEGWSCFIGGRCESS